MATKLDLPMDAIQEVCRRYRVRELSLFGSILTDEFRPQSDIDFLVSFDPEARIGFLELSRMQRELSELLHRKVDLVLKRGLKHAIRHEVLSRARVVYEA